MMGKVTNKQHSVEIIPLTGVQKRSHKSSIRTNILAQRLKKMNRMPYLSDPNLVPRVQKYLESNVDKTYVDIIVMADDLQRSYREYARLKRGPFRASVKKAYSIVLQSYGLEDQENTSSDEDLSDDTPDEGDSTQGNSLTTQLREFSNQLNLYKQGSAVPKQIDENELIDISSDDSEEPSQSASERAKSSSNGPSTSQQLPKEITVVNNQNPAKRFVERKNDKCPPLIYDRGKKRKPEDIIIPAHQSTPKKKRSMAILQEPSVTLLDVGGMDKAIMELQEHLRVIRNPTQFHARLPSPGILLYGPTGCGKTLLANAIAGELRVPLLKVIAPELVSGVSGESEQRIRELFERAVSSAPCVLLIDEIDTIATNRQNAQKEMERRIVAQLGGCLDELKKNPDGSTVLVIGTTNRPDAVDPSLRRAHRFELEICIQIPNAETRTNILKVLTRDLQLAEDFDSKTLAKFTPGFVGGDLEMLVNKAHSIAWRRLEDTVFEQQKLAKALAVRNAAEREKRRPKQTTEIPQPTDTIDLIKGDQEIIVDDDVPAPKLDPVTAPSDSSSDPIEVIDDEPKQADTVTSAPLALEPSTSEAAAVNGQNSQEEEEELTQQEPMALDLIKPTTPLENLLEYLKDPPTITSEHMKSFAIRMDDFQRAIKLVQPSAKREGFATIPDVTWDDIGGMEAVKEQLQDVILKPIKYADLYEKVNLKAPSGVLLCGPPGCGKTLIAKAIANETNLNFLAVKGPELLNMYVGESEKAIRVCFNRARCAAPCIIFFDEFEAICPKRSDGSEGTMSNRLVNTLLSEMDGTEERKGVYILAATNRPEIIDPAILRPGRIDSIQYLGLPTREGRIAILKTLTKNGPPLSDTVNLNLIGAGLEGYTGADLANLVRKTGSMAVDEYISNGEPSQLPMVYSEYYEKVISKLKPSVSEKDQKYYEKLRKQYTQDRNEWDVEDMELS